MRRLGSALFLVLGAACWITVARAADEPKVSLEIKPDDHKLLHKCLDVYVEQKAWQQALEMLERLISI